MGYTRDKDAHTRGVGAVAAADARDKRRTRAKQRALAARTASHDRRMAALGDWNRGSLLPSFSIGQAKESSSGEFGGSGGAGSPGAGGGQTGGRGGGLGFGTGNGRQLPGAGRNYGLNYARQRFAAVSGQPITNLARGLFGGSGYNSGPARSIDPGYGRGGSRTGGGLFGGGGGTSSGGGTMTPPQTAGGIPVPVDPSGASGGPSYGGGGGGGGGAPIDDQGGQPGGTQDDGGAAAAPTSILDQIADKVPGGKMGLLVGAGALAYLVFKRKKG